MQDEGCIPFARHRAHGGVSMATAWCDSTTLGKHETSLHGLRFITKALNDFSSKPEILSQAWTRLSPGLRNAAERLADRQRERETAAAAVMMELTAAARLARKAQTRAACVRVLHHDEFLHSSGKRGFGSIQANRIISKRLKHLSQNRFNDHLQTDVMAELPR